MKPLVDQRPLGQVFGIKLVILAVLLHQIGIDGMTVPDDAGSAVVKSTRNKTSPPTLRKLSVKCSCLERSMILCCSLIPKAAAVNSTDLTGPLKFCM
ncbi:hypothetical protein GEV33_002664 [Tenebrio molitor]|uniref:Uncharacterized protein n=1 Tax=Tenebrio molitor TaxID=7067 RepID=A0A8J6HTV3_TENMO|nr:hypothetical protein GEV33_002664 [Tenebrio molitor]